MIFESTDIPSIHYLLSGLGPAVLQSIRDPFGIVAPDYTVLWINRQLAGLHECEPADAIGNVCYVSMAHRDKPCTDCPLTPVINTGRTHIVEKWLDFSDGVRRWGEVRSYPVRGANKSLSAVITIVFDITAKKHDLQQQKDYSSFLSGKLKEKVGGSQQIHLDDGHITLRVALSRRETEILRLIAEGYSNIQISDLLSISNNTVKTHINGIFNKLGVNDRTHAAVLAVRHQLI